jgi:hypothetical protein
LLLLLKDCHTGRHFPQEITQTGGKFITEEYQQKKTAFITKKERIIMKKFMILLLGTALFLGCQNQAAKDDSGNASGAVLFADDFNRIDNETVGKGWVETEIGGSSAKIFSNSLRLTGGSGGVASGVTQAVSMNSPIKITMNFKLDNGSPLSNELLTGSDGYLFFINASSFYIAKIGSSSSPLSIVTTYPITPSVYYTAIIIKKGNSISMTISDKSSSSTASCNDSSYSDFSYYSIGGGTNSGVTAYSSYVDDVKIESL